MKIERFNESATPKSDELIEMIVNKFFDIDNSNMGSYHVNPQPIHPHKPLGNAILLEFNFVIVDDEEILQIAEFLKFVKKFTTPNHFYLEPFNVSDGIEMVKLNVRIKAEDAEKIYNELKMESDAKKYNI